VLPGGCGWNAGGKGYERAGGGVSADAKGIEPITPAIATMPPRISFFIYPSFGYGPWPRIRGRRMTIAMVKPKVAVLSTEADTEDVAGLTQQGVVKR
jgi:hypothetical protein